MAGIATALLLICTPAAGLLARLVEGKPNTFTIGGASFLGFLLAPVVIVVTSRILEAQWGFEVPLTPTLAAIGVAYAIGEGTGRLACISFGCCYGKPLSTVPGWLAPVFDRFHFIFRGDTKKAAYASGLEFVPLLPIQGLTAVVSAGAGLVGLVLFAHGFFHSAFLLTVVVTQAWRVLSEMLRADYRGEGRASITMYVDKDRI